MITRTDIKLFESERMDDTSDGGGRITGNEIISGSENSIFPDISRLDRSYGRVSIRQVFPAVDTHTTEVYQGAHVILKEIPQDPSVSLTLFSTKNWDAKRNELRDYIERYLSKGSKWIGYLLERQLVGQKAIIVWQRESVELPNIGSVWALIGDEGLSTQYEQYVRITKLTEKTQDYYDDRGKYTVRLLTCELSDPLVYDFTGVPPSRYDTNLTPQSTIRTTLPVDAARYYGTKKLEEDASIGDMNIVASSIYSQLVPSAQTEIPAVDLTAGSQNDSVIDSSKGLVSFTSSANIGANTGLYLGNAVVPGSLSLSITGGTITDDGGTLIVNGTTPCGSIQYSQGILTFSASCPTYSGSKNISFKPAASVTRILDTAAIAIMPENRGYSYTMTLHPKPAPGSLIIDFMSEGKWYRLYDKGNGSCRGLDSGYGSASVNYTTGSIVLTCGALPDNGSSILFYWGTPVSTFNRSNLPAPAPKIEFQLDHFPVAPSTFNVSWTNARSLADDGSGNLLGNGGTGKIVYSTGKVTIFPAILPLGGSHFTCNYSYGTPLEKEFNSPTRNGQGQLILVLDHTNIVPKTVEIELDVAVNDYQSNTSWSTEYIVTRSSWTESIAQSRDDGLGAFTLGQPLAGTCDYSTGVITITPTFTISIPTPIYSLHNVGIDRAAQSGGVATPLLNVRFMFDGFEYNEGAASFPLSGGKVKIRYRASDTPQSAVDEVHSIDHLKFDLTVNYSETIVPGSVRFDFSNRTYFDRDGYLYHSLNISTGAATEAGTINYESGVSNITDWVYTATPTITVDSLLTQITAQVVDEITFRAPGAPLRPGSLYVQANQLDGTQITCTAGSDGTLNTSSMVGTVDYETGLVRIKFGQWVEVAGQAGEPWYSTTAIHPVTGLIFKPKPIYPNTLRFNCVVYSYLPMSAEILGLDPVRLPFDGKVAIFKKSDLAVIHNTKKLACTNPLTAGAIINCGRQRLAELEVRDALGVVIDPNLYTDDLDAGTVTFATPLNLSAYTQPLYVHHTIEDMAQVVDVEITGRLSLNKPISHNYDKNDSYISSALIMKVDGEDLFARWTNPFSQQTWTNVWSDSLIGNTIVAKYNYNLSPIEVTNRGAIKQRWALIFTSTTTFNIVRRNTRTDRYRYNQSRLCASKSKHQHSLF